MARDTIRHAAIEMGYMLRERHGRRSAEAEPFCMTATRGASGFPDASAASSRAILLATVVRVTADDVRPMVDQMIELLRQPHGRSLSRRIADWFQGTSRRDEEWRAQTLSYFTDMRSRLDDPGRSFADDAAHLMRWLDWDLDLERQPESIGALAAKIQQALGLLDRSGAREPL
jgi:transcriptional regulator GlxA family with amidase domain